MRGRALVAPLLLTLLAGCAIPRGDAFEAAFAAGQRAKNAGRLDEAAVAFDQAARRAQRVKDRDEARFLEARAYEDAKRYDKARAAYQKLVDYNPEGPRGDRALFELAQIELDHGNVERGRQMLRDAIVARPKAALARPGLIRLVRDLSEGPGGDASAITLLDGLWPKLKATELRDTTLYERALAVYRQGDKQAAHDALVALAQANPYPTGALTDDALLRAAKIDRELGAPKHAVRDLHELLAVVETADTMGSYERPKFPEAQLLLGTIYRDDLHDDDAAMRAFMRVYEMHTTSVLRDDGLWQAALLAHRRADTSETCALARELVRALPESRYVSCAPELCPGAEVPPKTRACPSYIKRTITGEPPSAE